MKRAASSQSPKLDVRGGDIPGPQRRIRLEIRLLRDRQRLTKVRQALARVALQDERVAEPGQRLRVVGARPAAGVDA